VLFAESDKETYEEYKAEKCKKHLIEKTTSQNIEPSAIAEAYDKGNVPPMQNVTNNITINQQGAQIGSQVTGGNVTINGGINFGK
jgi:hypothetical protein